MEQTILSHTNLGVAVFPLKGVGFSIQLVPNFQDQNHDLVVGASSRYQAFLHGKKRSWHSLLHPLTILPLVPPLP